MRLSIPTTDQGHGPKRARLTSVYVPEDPLLKAAESAAETGRALSTFWRDVQAGRLPPAYYITPRCPRWRRSELRAAVEATRARSVQAVGTQK